MKSRSATIPRCGAGNAKPDKKRFLDVTLITSQPLTPNLSGLKVEYALALIHSSEAGKREAPLAFNVGRTLFAKESSIGLRRSSVDSAKCCRAHPQ